MSIRHSTRNAGTREDVRVTNPTTTAPVDHPYAAAIDLEHERFDELLMLIAGLDAEQRERPGYFTDDNWSVKDLVAHLGSWMAEAQVQLLQIEAGTDRDGQPDSHGVHRATRV